MSHGDSCRGVLDVGPGETADAPRAVPGGGQPGRGRQHGGRQRHRDEGVRQDPHRVRVGIGGKPGAFAANGTSTASSAR